MIRSLTLAAALALAGAVSIGGCSRAPPVSSAAPAAGAAPGSLASSAGDANTAAAPVGLDLALRDPSVRPGDDFYRYADGAWLSRTAIPPDRARWGAFDELAADAEAQVRRWVESIPADDKGSRRKVADYYHAYLDTASIEARGLAPARPGLAAIDAARSLSDLAALVGRPDFPIHWPLYISLETDEKNPDRYVVYVSQSGLSLPDRDFYLKPDEPLRNMRTKFVAHVERLLRLSGDREAASKARRILALETKIAQLHWPAERRRDVEATYNPRTRAQLEALDPAYPWAAFLESAGLGAQRDFVVRELDAVAGLEKLARDTSLPDWKAYLRYHYLAGMADVLPRAFDDERFAFYGRDLNGQERQRERWQRAIDSLDRALGEAVGELYVSRAFPPESRARVERLVADLRAAYAQRIKRLPWMAEHTKTVALEKLRSLRPKIGYPDRWRDYSALEIRTGDAFGNAIRAEAFDWNRRVARMGQPADRDEWQMTPQTVNAYYESTFNEIVFPAAILQPPFFDPKADDAVNYGAIGGVIGHEMGHTLDDQGSKSDERGVLRSWWTPGDTAAFRRITERLAGQYSAYEPLKGVHINGRLTLGENIGDLGGLQIAHEAYRISLHGASAPRVAGLSGDQRFFLAWSQAWRQVIRDERLRNQLLSDPHSPASFRVNGVVRNMDEWYAAFNVTPGDHLYLARQDRVHLW